MYYDIADQEMLKQERITIVSLNRHFNRLRDKKNGTRASSALHDTKLFGLGFVFVIEFGSFIRV